MASSPEQQVRRNPHGQTPGSKWPGVTTGEKFSPLSAAQAASVLLLAAWELEPRRPESQMHTA
jgi:hypothetical protein